MPAVAAQRHSTPGAVNDNNDGLRDMRATAVVEFESEDARIKAVRHLFIQSILNRKLASEKLATAIYDRCCEICGLEGADNFATFLADLNDRLSPLMLEIKRARDQETGAPQIVLTNSQADSVAKLATEFTAAEIAFFRSIVEAIVRARKLAYAILFQDAIKLYKGSSRQAAQNTLRALVARGWLRLLPSGYVILSTRSLSELSTYIRQQFDQEDDEEEDAEDSERYKAIVQCHACFDPVTIGYICPNPQCDVRLHKFCIAQKLGQSGRCPASIGDPEGCSQQWHRKDDGTFRGDPVGVEALGVELDDTQVDELDSNEDQQSQVQATPARSNGTRAARRGGRRNIVQDDEDQDEDMDDE
ncbi:hypothetical protein OIV83_001635 [Microbotryomycetes sp. JL201]|nr:hypothetical protein OIV83_001635 [Microbotryomycetes sp. JL201]